MSRGRDGLGPKCPVTIVKCIILSKCYYETVTKNQREKKSFVEQKMPCLWFSFIYDMQLIIYGVPLSLSATMSVSHRKGAAQF